MNRGVLADPAAHAKLRKKIPKRIREYVYKRDHHRCQHPECKNPCVPREHLCLHHCNYDPSDNRPINLLTSCTPCNNRDKNMHYAAAKKLRRFYQSLADYKTNQTHFNFD